MYFDPAYILYVFIPLLAISLVATVLLKAAYAKYSRIPNLQGITGAEAARLILRSAGIYDVEVEPSQGFLSDHYSPREKVLRLSPQNYSGHSIAAVGVAAHEAGHALQHAGQYAPLVLRNLAVPVANIGSTMGYVVIVVGLILSGGTGGVHPIALLGLALIASIAVFQLLNLPVEFDASRRALHVLPRTGILTAEEARGARSVLAAAAFTYVAATVAAILELLYWAWRLGLIGGSSDRD